MKAAFDPQALVDAFAGASARQGEQLRQAVRQAVLGALKGRELSLKNIRGVLDTVTQAASAGAARSGLPEIDVQDLLDNVVAGMDEALVKAVEANRVALQQFVDQGVGLQEKQLKKAVSELEKFEDTFIGAVRKSAEAAGGLGAPWHPVLEKLQAGGTLTGAQASDTAEQFAQQMKTAMRDSRAAGMKAAQALAESYAALVSGVLIGMSDAMQQGTGATGQEGGSTRSPRRR